MTKFTTCGKNSHESALPLFQNIAAELTLENFFLHNDKAHRWCCFIMTPVKCSEYFSVPNLPQDIAVHLTFESCVFFTATQRADDVVSSWHFGNGFCWRPVLRRCSLVRYDFVTSQKALSCVTWHTVTIQKVFSYVAWSVATPTAF